MRKAEDWSRSPLSEGQSSRKRGEKTARQQASKEQEVREEQWGSGREAGVLRKVTHRRRRCLGGQVCWAQQLLGPQCRWPGQCQEAPP